MLRAASRLAPDLARLTSLGLPTDSVVDVFYTWLQGITTQLANFPADLRIESWIHEHFPGLRRIQERSLLFEVKKCAPLFDAMVVEMTPRIVYSPTMAMNAAQAYHVGGLFGKPELMGPFDQRGLGDKGRYLAHLVFAAEDQGHRSDMEAVNHWARELALEGWFEWRQYEGSR